jgi:penicillin-insensitive murein DD-endopeptidase
MCANPDPMKLLRRAAAPALLLAGIAAAAAWGAETNVWSRVGEPTAGPAEAIGGNAHGCLAGARRLPFEGTGYEVIRLSRRRYFGHPDTIAFVERLGRRAAAAGLPRFYVGDMAQPRGGPLPFGHASHQTGMDVDIWFTFAAGPLLPAAREDVDLPSMLRANWKQVDPKRFTRRQVTLLQLAATDPAVERIFVNPVIKEDLCRIIPPARRAWLHKLRPWWGHDDHFHVRLNCPAGARQCLTQTPVPPGDGCDAVLASWVRDQHPPPAHPAPPPPRKLPRLPAACRAVLDAP